MKNSLTFLSGCMAGALTTYLLYLSTHYLAQSDRVEEDRIELEADAITDRAPTVEQRLAGVDLRKWLQSEASIIGGGYGGYTAAVDHGSVRGVVLQVVHSSMKGLERALHDISSTWGASINDWQVAAGTKGIELAHADQSHLLLLQNCEDFDDRTVLSAEKLFCLLQKIHDTHIEQYQWFIISPRSTYVALNQLVKTLMQFDSSKVSYIGLPSSYSVPEMTRHGLVSHERICRGRAGIVLSRAALKGIVPYLQGCLGYGFSQGLRGLRGKGDVELGRCFSRRLGVTCSQSVDSKVDLSSWFVTGPTTHPLHIQHFLTLSHVLTRSHLLHVHLYDLVRQMTALANLQDASARSALSICTQLPQADAEPGLTVCNFTLAPSHVTDPNLHLLVAPPTQLNEVVRWEVISGNEMYNSEMVSPVRGLSDNTKHEVDFVLKRTIAALGGAKRWSPVKIHYVLLRYRGLVGREYLMDLTLRNHTGGLVEKRVSVLLPHLENMFQIESTNHPLVDKNVEFVVPTSGINKRLFEFLDMYEDVCLKTDERCNLNLVVYGEPDLKIISDSLRSLRLKYPTASLRLVTGKGRFSRGRALDLGISTLSRNDLVFMCDVDMEITGDFLQRCQHNTIKNKQVYYPEFFKYYNMDYVYRFTKRPRRLSISRQNGHWAKYSYGMVCMYQGDYVRTGGFDTKIEGWGGEDNDLAMKVLKKGLNILRAPDPALSHRYHDKVCSTNLTPRQFASCIDSRNEDLADRTRLAEYVFYLEEKYKTKKWTLWS